MSLNKQFESNPILTEPYPKWIEPLPINHVNAKMMRLIQFFVLNSPCKESSWGRKSMDSYGWINYWNSDIFRDLIFSSAELDELHPYDTPTALAKKIPIIDCYYYSQYEFAYFVKAEEESPLMNLFHRIRNAFAHGRFRMNGDYFFFEDVKQSGEKIIVNARICLNIKTMQAWYDIISCKNKKAITVQENMRKNKI